MPTSGEQLVRAMLDVLRRQVESQLHLPPDLIKLMRFPLDPVILHGSYGRRTSPVRVLSVGAVSFAQHTGYMATNTRGTTFVTGAAGPAVALGFGESFDSVVLPHLDAAYRLARWLMRDADDAQDVVQEASLRAFRYFRTFVGGDGRAWFLRIVRNTCYGWRRHRGQPPTDSFDEVQHSGARPQSDPETLLLQTDDATLIARALNRLPDHFHQLLVLRELEGLSYRELSDVIGIPMGTVMSRLSRAREALRNSLDTELPQSGISSRPHSREQEADTVLV